MDTIIEIAKYFAGALAGGGALTLFNLRASIRRNANQISEADFDTVSKVVKSATADLKALAARIGELEKDKIMILEEVSKLQEDKAILQDQVKALQNENQRLETILKRYISKNNPTMSK